MPRAKAAGSERAKEAAKVVRALAQTYPDAVCALVHADAYQLIVATILSAQCTDVRVNMVTPALFARYPDPAALASADQADVEELIRSTGFFRSKAKNLIAMAKQVVESHDKKIPADLDALTALAGVGRKTANVVLGTAFGLATGIVVDTHVKRLTYRLGLTAKRDPVKIELDLVEIIPSKEWVNLSHRLIAHGRQVCYARKPHCDECPLAKLCPKVGVTA